MNMLEHDLTILNEECIELAMELLNLAKLADKAKRFGMEDHHPQEMKTNATAIIEEFSHVCTSMSRLSNHGVFNDYFETMGAMTFNELMDKKNDKLTFYIEVSRKNGCLDKEE